VGLWLDRRFCCGSGVFGLGKGGISRFAFDFTPAFGRVECRFAAGFGREAEASLYLAATARAKANTKQKQKQKLQGALEGGF
jgi:hypothetical protein